MSSVSSSSTGVVFVVWPVRRVVWKVPCPAAGGCAVVSVELWPARVWGWWLVVRAGARVVVGWVWRRRVAVCGFEAVVAVVDRVAGRLVGGVLVERRELLDVAG